MSMDYLYAQLPDLIYNSAEFLGTSSSGTIKIDVNNNMGVINANVLRTPGVLRIKNYNSLSGIDSEFNGSSDLYLEIPKVPEPMDLEAASVTQDDINKNYFPANTIVGSPYLKIKVTDDKIVRVLVPTPEIRSKISTIKTFFVYSYENLNQIPDLQEGDSFFVLRYGKILRYSFINGSFIDTEEVLAGNVYAILDTGFLVVASTNADGSIAFTVLRAEVDRIEARLNDKIETLKDETAKQFEEATASLNAAKELIKSEIEQSTLITTLDIDTKVSAAKQELNYAISELDLTIKTNISTSISLLESKINNDINPKLNNLQNLKQDNLSFDGEYNTSSNKVATVSTVNNKVADELVRAEAAEQALLAQINRLVNNPDTPDIIDSINEFTSYIDSHGSVAAGMQANISTNTGNISALNSALDTYKDSNNAALAAVKVIAEAARTESEVNTQIDSKISGLNLPLTYEPLGAEDRAKVYTDRVIESANLEQYTTEQEVKSIVDNVIANAVLGDALEGLTDLVEYLDSHGREAAGMASAINVLEDKVEVVENKPAYNITSTLISNWDNEVGAKALAESKTTTAEVKTLIEQYNYATLGDLDLAKQEASNNAAAVAATITQQYQAADTALESRLLNQIDLISLIDSAITLEKPFVLTLDFGYYKLNGAASKEFGTVGQSLHQFLQGALASEDKTIFSTSPLCSISMSGGSYEAGSIVSPSASWSTSAGTYKWGTYSNGAANYSDKNTGITYKDSSGGILDANDISIDKTNFTLLDGLTTVIASGTAVRSAVTKYPCSNLGSDLSSNLAAEYKSEKTSTITKEATFTGYRKSFYGVLSEKVELTNANIRDICTTLTSSSLALSNGSYFEINIPASTLDKPIYRVLIAYPATLRNMTSVLDENDSNSNVVSGFEKSLSILNIEGANGYDAIEYKVYVQDFAEPYNAKNKYKVTI